MVDFHGLSASFGHSFSRNSFFTIHSTSAYELNLQSLATLVCFHRQVSLNINKWFSKALTTQSVCVMPVKHSSPGPIELITAPPTETLASLTRCRITFMVSVFSLFCTVMAKDLREHFFTCVTLSRGLPRDLKLSTSVLWKTMIVRQTRNTFRPFLSKRPIPRHLSTLPENRSADATPSQEKSFENAALTNLSDGHDVEAATANKVTIVGLFSDVGLLGLKGTVGYMSGSAALIADAVHSGSDLASGIVTLAALRLARKPPDEKHPYGYGHYESLGSLGVASLLVLGGISSAHFAGTYLTQQFDLSNMLTALTQGDILHFRLAAEAAGQVQYVPAALTCCAVSVIIKEVMFRYTRYEGEKQNSPVLVANAWHHRSDSLTSVAAFCGISGYLVGIPILDPLLGLAVAGVVLKTAVDIGWTAVADLTDRQRSADAYLISRVEQIGQELHKRTRGEVTNIHSIKRRRIGNYLLLDVHVSVDPKLSVTAAFQASSKVRQTIVATLPEVKDVSVRIQAHLPRKQPIQNPAEKSAELGKTCDTRQSLRRSLTLKGIKDLMKKPKVAIMGKVSQLETRSQFEIEQDIHEAVERVRSRGGCVTTDSIRGVSHCSVHFKVSDVDPQHGRRHMQQSVEVNLIMDEMLTLAEAQVAALEVEKEILLISDIHDVDIHVEVLHTR